MHACVCTCNTPARCPFDKLALILAVLACAHPSPGWLPSHHPSTVLVWHVYTRASSCLEAVGMAHGPRPVHGCMPRHCLRVALSCPGIINIVIIIREPLRCAALPLPWPVLCAALATCPFSWFLALLYHTNALVLRRLPTRLPFVCKLKPCVRACL